jgi:hypothetical protein
MKQSKGRLRAAFYVSLTSDPVFPGGNSVGNKLLICFVLIVGATRLA